MWMWGLDAQRFLAPLPAWLPWALAAAALLPPLARPLAALLARLGDAIERRPHASAIGWGAFAGLLAWMLPDRVHFTGDFQLRLDALEAGTISIGRWTPVALPLDLALHQGLVRLFHDALTVDWITATCILGAIEAALLGALATRFARVLGLRGSSAACAAAIVLFGGSLPLFTGYDKSFMELVLLTAVVGIWGLEMVRKGRGAVALGLAASAGFALHRSSLALLVGLVAAWLLARHDAGLETAVAHPPRRSWASRVLRAAATIAAFVLPAAVLAAMIPLMLEAVRKYDPVHLATAGSAGGIVASAVAPERLLDLANLILLLSPLALAAPILLAIDRSWRQREAVFLLVLLAPYLLAMLFVHPHQGMFRDVDDFAAAGMALSLPAAWQVARVIAIPKHAWLAAPVVLGVAMPVLQWMLLSADLERGLARVHAFGAESPRRSELVLAQTWDFLGMRYIKLERWGQGARALEQAAVHAPSARILTQWAVCEMRLGNVETAYALFERVVVKKPDDFYAWHELAAASLTLGRLEAGRLAAQQMLRLDPGDDEAPLILAEIVRREGVEAATSR